jgi:hypothetical protein
MLSSRNNVMFAIPRESSCGRRNGHSPSRRGDRRAGVRIPEWLDVVGEFEALLALGTFTAEHPDHTFPVFSNAPAGVTHLEVDHAAHPTLGPGAVRNSVSLQGASQPSRNWRRAGRQPGIAGAARRQRVQHVG